MYTAILSVLLMGVFPVWGTGELPEHIPLTIDVGSPVLTQDVRGSFTDLHRMLSASGVIIMDLDSGQNLYAYASEVPRPIASLTKLMTALLIVENHTLDEWVRVPESADDVVGNRAYLVPGEEYTVGDLLSALLIASGNDAAVTLAQFHAGSIEAFVHEMNERAVMLGLHHTSFSNPIGLDAPGQSSTPQDLGWLAMFALRNSDIRIRLSTRGARIRSLGGQMVYLTHTHALMHAGTSVIAGKTGTTNGAGECLLSLVKSGNRTYLVILLNSLQRYADMRQILGALTL
ncbi:hypothetical protein A2635_04145 [Candidatus Peribacteria bacterium RIFCSPHIGHO2_01_FULL_51_9]|nr:MAG: hypothetical protein A2635_04145 [Candidatus Peribacteria bacterium RIFCSPHIGHO2_01_FULL_51_9]